MGLSPPFSPQPWRIERKRLAIRSGVSSCLFPIMSTLDHWTWYYQIIFCDSIETGSSAGVLFNLDWPREYMFTKLCFSQMQKLSLLIICSSSLQSVSRVMSNCKKSDQMKVKRGSSPATVVLTYAICKLFGIISSSYILIANNSFTCSFNPSCSFQVPPWNRCRGARSKSSTIIY